MATTASDALQQWRLALANQRGNRAPAGDSILIFGDSITDTGGSLIFETMKPCLVRLARIIDRAAARIPPDHDDADAWMDEMDDEGWMEGTD